MAIKLLSHGRIARPVKTSFAPSDPFIGCPAWTKWLNRVSSASFHGNLNGIDLKSECNEAEKKK